MNDPVNHPKHYTEHPSGIECIQVTEHMGFNLGNSLKYIWRCDLKSDAIEDLKKARWYIDREILKREREQHGKNQQEQNESMEEEWDGAQFSFQFHQLDQDSSPTRYVIDESKSRNLSFSISSEGSSGYRTGSYSVRGITVNGKQILTPTVDVNYNHGTYWNGVTPSGWELSFGFLKD